MPGLSVRIVRMNELGMRFFEDNNGSVCVEWEQAFGHKKRAWIQHRTDAAKNWADTPDARYLNVVRVDKISGNAAGNPQTSRSSATPRIVRFLRLLCFRFVP